MSAYLYSEWNVQDLSELFFNISLNQQALGDFNGRVLPMHIIPGTARTTAQLPTRPAGLSSGLAGVNLVFSRSGG